MRIGIVSFETATSNTKPGAMSLLWGFREKLLRNCGGILTGDICQWPSRTLSLIPGMSVASSCKSCVERVGTISRPSDEKASYGSVLNTDLCNDFHDYRSMWGIRTLTNAILLSDKEIYLPPSSSPSTANCVSSSSVTWNDSRHFRASSEIGVLLKKER